MKKLFKISSYIVATAMVLVLSQVSALAFSNNGDNASSLTATQVVGSVALLLFAILLPLVRSARKTSVNINS